MMTKNSKLDPPVNSFAKTLLKGLIIGVVATEVLDWVSTVIYENEDRATRIAEDDARGGMHAYEVAVKDFAEKAGVSLNREQITKWGWRFHKSFGYFGGVQYVLMRNRKPQVGRLNGFLFGTGFFFIVDELMMPLMRWTPGPTAFSWKVHARGAIAHISYGIAAETAAKALDQIDQASEPKKAA